MTKWLAGIFGCALVVTILITAIYYKRDYLRGFSTRSPCQFTELESGQGPATSEEYLEGYAEESEVSLQTETNHVPPVRHCTHYNNCSILQSGGFKSNDYVNPSKYIFTDRKGRLCFHRRVSFCPQSALWKVGHLRRGRYASYWNASLLNTFLFLLLVN